MKSRRIYTFICSLALCLSACQKDLDVLVPDNITLDSSTVWYNDIPLTAPVYDLQNSLLLNTYKDTFQLQQGTVGVYGTGAGYQLEVAGGSLSYGNVPSTPYFGAIFTESLLLKKKGDMIRMGVPTISNEQLMVSGGAAFVKLSDSSGNLVVNANSTISVSITDSTVVPQMKYFLAEQPLFPDFNWTRPTDSVNNNVLIGNDFYKIQTRNLGWISAGYLFNNTGIAQTKIVADLPATYTNANTIAFVSFNDMRSVIKMNGTAVSRHFNSNNLPVDKQVTVIVISKRGNDFYLGYSPALTSAQLTADGLQHITVTPTLTSLGNILQYLSTL